MPCAIQGGQGAQVAFSGPLGPIYTPLLWFFKTLAIWRESSCGVLRVGGSSKKRSPWQNGPVEVLLIFPDQNRRKVAERVINQVGAFLEM